MNTALFSTVPQISIDAKEVFAEILKQYEAFPEKDQTAFKLKTEREDDGKMDLVVEKVDSVTTPMGDGNIYSFAHYYKQNGDLMRDPEITYLVVDAREGKEGNLKKLFVCPTTYQLDSLGRYQEVVEFKEGGRMFANKKAIRDLAAFTTTWMNNVQNTFNINPIRNKA